MKYKLVPSAEFFSGEAFLRWKLYEKRWLRWRYVRSCTTQADAQHLVNHLSTPVAYLEPRT